MYQNLNLEHGIKIIVYTLTLLLMVDFVLTQDVVRQTQYGKIRGSIQTSRLDPNITFYQFLGVQYGRPPVGSLHFKEPSPPIPWTGIKDALTHANICVQIDKDFAGDQVIGDEDCLYLAIAEPITARSELTPKQLPVMVWVHGGSFLFGSLEETAADPFMQEPVVVVLIQYRLNVFGFLSTEDDYAKGNLGLKDQTAALIWIQNNIENFGGDPNSITIFGGSAGAASIQFQMLSPRSSGLFHKAISQSGVTFSTWVFQSKPKEKAQKLGEAFGIDPTNSETLVQQLQSIPADILVKTAYNQSVMGPYILFDGAPFLPIIEHDSNTAFLTDRVYKLIEEGNFNKVPYMIGCATEEGSFPYDYISNGAIDINIFQENSKLLVPTSMNIPEGDPCISSTIDSIHQFFFNNGSFTDKVNWITFMGQDIRGIQKTAELICDRYPHYPIYYYMFSYVGTNSLGYIGGAGHYSEVLKLFYPVHSGWSTTLTPADQLVQKRLTKLWTNFAYYGHPTLTKSSLLQNISWPTYCFAREYLDIGNDLVVKTYPNRTVYEFWEETFQKCGFPPYNTY